MNKKQFDIRKIEEGAYYPGVFIIKLKKILKENIQYDDFDDEDWRTLVPDPITKILEAFFEWLDAQNPIRNTRLDKAVTYINNRREFLTTYLEDGRCSFSNNASENAIRPFTVGRKIGFSPIHLPELQLVLQSIVL